MLKSTQLSGLAIFSIVMDGSALSQCVGTPSSFLDSELQKLIGTHHFCWDGEFLSGRPL